MKRTYFKLNIDDVMEIVSEHLAEKSGYKTFGTNTRIFSDEKNWNMIIVIGEVDDLEIHKINMNELNEKLEYNGTHGLENYWKTDDELKKAVDKFIKKNREDRFVYKVFEKIKNIFHI